VTDIAERLTGWLLPGILMAFLTLYALAIRSGMEPEIALLQAGGAGAVLAVLGRLAISVVSVGSNTTESINLAAGSATLEEDPDGERAALDEVEP
jgi:hypothetical protein